MARHLFKITAGLLFAAALPAAAQQNYCGGTAGNGQWIGGDAMTSDVSASPDYMEQMALVLLRNEYVSLFTVSQGTEVRVEASGRGSGDTMIDLRNDAGTVILSDDDSGGNGASRGEIFLDPGTYCISMRSYDGAPLTGFVRVGRMEHEPLTAGLDAGAFDGTSEACMPDTPAAILGNGPFMGDALTATNTIDGTPFYRFTLGTDMPLTVLAENPGADPVLMLYDNYGTLLAENDDFDGLNSRIDMQTSLPAGTYCIGLHAYSDAYQPVTVTLKGYDAEEVLNGLYARGEASPPLGGTYPVTDLGVLQSRLRQDAQVSGDTAWFAVDVPESGLLLIEAIAQGNGDPVLVLFDELGRQIAYNDDFGGGLDSQVTARVDRGIYMIGVHQLDDSIQGFIRILAERFVPAQ